MSDLKIVDVRKAYGKTEILHGIDINIDHAEFVVFVGPSGCGKSTLLRTIAGLEDITSGDLFIGGQRVNELPPSRRGIAMVFQSYALYPHMNVYKNMAFGLRLAKGDRQAIDRKVREAARILQLEPLLKRLPRELSGGQRQRVAIGRAIVRDPNVFLFDEPLSNLDAALRVQTRVEIAKLHQDLKTTIIYVTHDQVEAMTLADKIVVLNEGCVEQIGSPLELYFHPANRFVAGFIGSPAMNFVDVVIADVGDKHVDIRLPDGRVARLHLAGAGARPGHQATLGIRPEHMIEGDAEGIQLGGSVEVVERLGDDSYVYVRQDGGSNLTLRADGHSRIRAGDTVVFSAESDAVHLFDADGKAFTRLGSNPKYNAELIESAAAS